MPTRYTPDQKRQRARAAYLKFINKPGNENYNKLALRAWRQRNKPYSRCIERTKRSTDRRIPIGKLTYTISHDCPECEGLLPLSKSRQRHEADRKKAQQHERKRFTGKISPVTS